MPEQTELEQLLEDASRIPAAPGVAMELARLCREADASIEHLVAILKCDPTLSAKVLRVANSAYFAARRKIADLSEAIIRLGLRRVQIMALAFCIMEATSSRAQRLGGFDYNYFWSHAVVTGTFADVLASARRMRLAVEALVAGLMQDIGVLVIQTCMPEKYRPVLGARSRLQTELHVAETKRLGFNHMQAGELLLRRWHIPEQVCLVVGNHHQPENTKLVGEPVYELARTCNLGAAVAKVLTNEHGTVRHLSQAAELAKNYFAMDLEEFQRILGQVRSGLDASAEIFDVHLDSLMIRRLDAAIRDCIAECTMQLPDQSEAHEEQG